MLLAATCVMTMARLSQGAPPPRAVHVDGQQFALATGEPIILVGPNVVVKGPPYLPSVSGDTFCNDVVNDVCTAAGNCTTCSTFNQADVDHIKQMGWNTIRLGVVWAGAQPEDNGALDPDFVRKLHAILNLTDTAGLHVILDNHGDMVGTAGCGNGVPMWFQQKASPELVGKPLETDLPFKVLPSLRVEELKGYAVCGANATKWARFAGDPNYNLLNECCQALNVDGLSGTNPPANGYTTVAQATMKYLVEPGAGRDAFVAFWALMAHAVAEHPSAVGCELMNEPMSIRRRSMFQTWRAAAEAINTVVPDMMVALADTGEGAVLPAWAVRVGGGWLDIDRETEEWIKQATTVFYAWHWYGKPSDPADAVKNVLALSAKWNVPTFETEFFSCGGWNAARAANISTSYWHYSAYCNTGPPFGNRSVPDDTFGACILGWAGGDSSKVC